VLQTFHISDISSIQFGIHVQPSEEGRVRYLQARHFNEFHELSETVDSWLPLDNASESHLLSDGDILLVGKGYRNFAWLYKSEIGPAVASSIFFVIKPKAEKVLPGFLSIFFNLQQTQQHFQTLGAGSSIPSIRKSELEALPVSLPPLAEQEKLVDLHKIYESEMRLSRQLITQKQVLFESVAQKLIRGEIRKKI
jgi:hypothetical protein